MLVEDFARNLLNQHLSVSFAVTPGIAGGTFAGAQVNVGESFTLTVTLNNTASDPSIVFRDLVVTVIGTSIASAGPPNQQSVALLAPADTPVPLAFPMTALTSLDVVLRRGGFNQIVLQGNETVANVDVKTSIEVPQVNREYPAVGDVLPAVAPGIPN